MGTPHTSTSPIHCDTQNVIQIVHNYVFHERAKYIVINCHIIRYHLQQGTLHLRSVYSKD
jgi:hypothetical protein